MRECENARMRECENARMRECENARMFDFGFPNLHYDYYFIVVNETNSRKMTEKENFINNFKCRTKKLAVDIIKMLDGLQKQKSSNAITYQLIRSVTSVAANYRAACRARSKKEFHSKICIVVEEADETLFWLELLTDLNFLDQKTDLVKLIDETRQILKVVAKAKNTNYQN